MRALQPTSGVPDMSFRNGSEWLNQILQEAIVFLKAKPYEMSRGEILPILTALAFGASHVQERESPESTLSVDSGFFW